MKADFLIRLPMDIVRLASVKYNVDENLIAAICQQESSCNPYAWRFEPGWQYFLKPDLCAKDIGCSLETERKGQACSWGLMQVMGAVLREHGFKGWFGESFTPKVNLDYGVKHLKKFIDKYPDIESAIASYNAGSPRKGADGRFINQNYVDSVLKWKAEADGVRK